MSKNIYFTPGPTQLFYTVEGHIKSALKDDIGSISHRSKAFEKVFAEARENLTELLGLSQGHEIYFTSSANEIWERIIQNLVAHRSHHFSNGSFAKKFYSFAKDYQKDSILTESGPGKPFEDLSIAEGSELISCTLNETSIGYTFPIQDIYDLKAKHPDKLVAVDGVSAFPCIPFDFSKVDTAYFSVQKSFGLPSGLGVWILNKACVEKAEQLEANGQITGSYHKLSELRKHGAKNQTPETPNTLGIYLLGKVAKDMIDRGVKNIQNETIYKSTLLYQTLENHPDFNPFIENKEHRSKTVVVSECKNGSAEVIERFKKKGWILGSGYSSFKADHIRIANFPMHSKEQIEQLCDYFNQG
ncbi:aminotransferase class V-fold PLP-dependent enzyme [Marinoscillum sp. MHG1-6]|uniref:aminotransferase class V-fold PLP-dependent enzyme n=1 Tax=Marinoscillum sp. MHG1-6 TaxID=2959627 RepID=UPI002158457C|nr:aminotransferase class V-fold PLP-dependent enzyme [Marinoscillum sp. MHG1-6]